MDISKWAENETYERREQIRERSPMIKIWLFPFEKSKKNILSLDHSSVKVLKHIPSDKITYELLSRFSSPTFILS